MAASTSEWWRRYNAYLKTPEWRMLANQVKKRAGWRCECTRYGCHGWGRCNDQGTLQANHLTYKRVFHEDLNDLEALCIPCHEKYTRKSRARRRRPSWWRTLVS